MKMKKTALLGVVLTLTTVFAFLAGCGGGGGGASYPLATVSGTVEAPDRVSLGRIAGRSASAPQGLSKKSNVPVLIYYVDDEGNKNGSDIDRGITDENGDFNLTVPANASGFMMIETGSGDNLMRSIAYSFKKKVSVSPMTELVISEIISRGIPLSHYKMEEIETIISQATLDATDIDLKGQSSVKSVLTKLKENATLMMHLNSGIAQTKVTTCGNNTIDEGEVCDGPALGDQSCASKGHDAGELSCKPDCSSFVETGCTDVCGDNHAADNQACDGTDLKGRSCKDVGYPNGGTLNCSATCEIDTAGCVPDATCGNGSCELIETQTSCPQDCGCPLGQILCGATCETPACNDNAAATIRWPARQTSAITPGHALPPVPIRLLQPVLGETPAVRTDAIR